MSKQTISWEFEDENGDYHNLDIPARYEVCDQCEGHGSHLNENIGSHAYSMEEFYESFDDEEQEEYFKRGGRYDVECSNCGGKRVELIADFSATWPTSPDGPDHDLKKAYQQQCNNHAAWDSEDRAERRRERLMRGEWD